MSQLLNLEHVSVFFDTAEGTVQAVRDISLSLQKGEILAIVGESGSGKSVLCKSVMKLLPKNSRIKGKILLQGNDILPFTDKEMCKLRGTDFAMLFQDPMTVLNPTIPVGKQIIEAILQHKKISYKEATHQAINLLDMVGIDDPVQRMKLQPHFFSGGMRQRCVLAIALALSPKILFADEPTTALDVTVQANILDLLKKIQKKTGIGIIIITHDLGVVARIADRVAVMYAGKIVETGTVEDIFYNSQHPYTWGLLGALPSLAVELGELKAIPGVAPSPINYPKGDAFAERNEYALAIDYKNMPPIFKVSESHSVASWLLDKRAPTITPPPYTRNLHKKTAVSSENNNSIKEKKQYRKTEILLSVRDYHQNFQINKKFLINAVNGISFDIHKNEFFGLVGESGCGKSTLAKAIMGMVKPTHGDIYFKNYTVSGGHSYSKHKKEIQRNMQIIFQDSLASLNPYMKINDIIAEPLDIHRLYSNKQERDALVTELLHKVGLDTRIKKKLPEELSGGQRQRVSIARSIALQPELIIADEPITSLDISIQAQIINLFQQLRKERDFSLLFIAHDLSMVQYLCDRVGVMYKGKIVELAPTGVLFKNPIHLYTRSLLSAIPRPDPIKERSKKILSSASIEPPQHSVMKEVEPNHFVLM